MKLFIALAVLTVCAQAKPHRFGSNGGAGGGSVGADGFVGGRPIYIDPRWVGGFVGMYNGPPIWDLGVGGIDSHPDEIEGPSATSDDCADDEIEDSGFAMDDISNGLHVIDDGFEDDDSFDGGFGGHGGQGGMGGFGGLGGMGGFGGR